MTESVLILLGVIAEAAAEADIHKKILRSRTLDLRTTILIISYEKMEDVMNSVQYNGNLAVLTH